MLRFSLPHQHEMPVYYTNSKLDTHAIFSLIGPPRRSDAWTNCRTFGIEYLSRGHNEALPSSGAETRAYNLAVAILVLLSTELQLRWFKV